MESQEAPASGFNLTFRKMTYASEKNKNKNEKMKEAHASEEKRL